MANSDDFTFCPAGACDDQDGIETQKVVQDISGITLEDKSSIGVSSSQGNGVLWSDMSLSNAASQKQETVGSLTFTVTDASTRKQVNESRSQGTVENTGSKASLEKKKPAPRTKVPFEKGYSQMDWMKLTRTHPDLAGLKGQSNRRLISLNEVKQHQTEDSMWTVLKGRVYNIAPYMKFHPGGVDMLTKAVGKDCTSLFNKYHAWVNAEILLEKCLVGILDDST